MQLHCTWEMLDQHNLPKHGVQKQRDVALHWHGMAAANRCLDGQEQGSRLIVSMQPLHRVPVICQRTMLIV